MKTLLLILTLFTSRLSAQVVFGYYVSISIENSSGGLPVHVTDGDSSVNLLTDSNGLAFGILLSSHAWDCIGIYTDCLGNTDTVWLGGIDTLYAAGMYCESAQVTSTLCDCPPVPINAEIRYYTINGVRKYEPLDSGVYVRVRQGWKTIKVFIP